MAEMLRIKHGPVFELKEGWTPERVRAAAERYDRNGPDSRCEPTGWKRWLRPVHHRNEKVGSPWWGEKDPKGHDAFIDSALAALAASNSGDLMVCRRCGKVAHELR